jgi:hypothetical protein
MRRIFSVLVVGVGATVVFGACGGSNKAGSGFPGDGGTSSGGSGSSSGGSASGSGGGSSSGSLVGDGSTADSGLTGDPTTCSGSAQLHSYIGCDYWPTVVANNVWSIFDYAVVVANAESAAANITVTGPGGTNQTATVAPNGLTKIYLPWVAPLKGPDTNNCGAATPLSASVLAHASAYHLVSSIPVTVYQFNALEYKGAGGAAGKNWAACPGNSVCATEGSAVGCFSFSNDASLLLPSTAMTGNYLVVGHAGWGTATIGSTTSITSTTDNTTVTVKVSSTGSVIAGGGIAATAAGGSLTLTLNAGDVAELVGGSADTDDNSGSIITANNPIQVITGMPCLDVPDTAEACDHVEETVLPAETLGEDYIVTQPTGPNGDAVVQNVRIYGEVDNTQLVYSTKPTNCPPTINKGQVVNCGQVQQDFEVKANQPFAVAMFTDGASIVDPSTQPPNQQGDPDETMAVAVPQYRTNYVFLAPTDYEDSYAVVVAPTGTAVTVDGTVSSATPTPITGTTFGVLRIKLDNSGTGAHTLNASNPVSIQVMGYGSYTSYTYPGGLDLQHISPPPPAN